MGNPRKQPQKSGPAAQHRPKNPQLLRITILSDTTFSRGEGTAGAVDIEVEHDAYGLPLIGGKTVRGLLRDTWLSMAPHFENLHDAAHRVLGASHALDDRCQLRIGDAHLTHSLRQPLHTAVTRSAAPFAPSAMLQGLTAIRHQTAEDCTTGAPATATLRSSRVAMRTLVFDAPLSWAATYQSSAEDKQVLALCALATRHGGLLRNRGRGHLEITIDGDGDKTRKAAHPGGR